ncbi:DNA-binding protein RFX5 isoform X1 [Bufo bufo]|uniref:DNA-binding protein RFX5 isoform X1 n=1 Tax=Bufo bufo TaxID=8384 RepID=UPI001ABE2297|nr:DNA-binding protein RFX5 isoform X1 [Bufo bufo]XP_040267819.1 DNA-binding protein RFX5 isoform X1 [Bufo bufo]XP_040267820.1 DNA-binding protein RFX5 isoform X1 [Bufo bufo]
MAEDVLYESISTKEGLTAGDVQEDTEPSNLLQKLRNRISKSVQSKVDSILGDVQKLSDYDKLYLYLQLPPGPSGPEKSLDVSSVTTAEHMHACTWIRNHLEEHTDTCLPKQDVYDAYKRYCDNLCGRPLSVANFGKIIREIFPNIKARRLGGRGQSKYCYSGLRRKSMVSMPPLPSLDLKMTESSELTDLVQSYNNDVIHASCALICNWAEKILKRSFNNVVEVAQFLIQQHIINPRSANAELVLSMVLSDNSQSSGQKIHKQPPDAAGSKRPGSPDSGAEVTSKNKTTNNLPSSPPQVKKRPPEPQKPANSPQVDALVARLPVLLPRLPTEEKYISSSPPVRFNPPVLAPNLIPGQLKVSPLPFTHGMPLTVTGVNGTGLVSQPVAPPVISMILPDMTNLESHALSKTKQNGSKDFAAAGSTADSKGTKRPAAAAAGMSTEEGPSRRKRGRPRKMDASPAKSSNQGNMAAGRVVMDGTRKDSDREASVLPRPFIPDNQLIVSHRTVDPMEATAGSDTKMAAETVPNQVSVIQDGRQSFAQWTVRPGDSQKQQQGSDKAPTIGQTE